MENLDVKKWKDKTVFVTGAAGFLGQWLIKDLLSKGAHVVALIREKVPTLFLEVLLRLVLDSGFSCVVRAQVVDLIFSFLITFLKDFLQLLHL